MSETKTTSFYEQVEDDTKVIYKRRFKELPFFALIGFFLLLINFPNFLNQLININVQNKTAQNILLFPIEITQRFLKFLIGDDLINFFERAMTCCFVMLLIYITLLIILSLRRKGFLMFCFGILGILLGYLTLHLIAWIAVALVVTIKGIIYVAYWAGEWASVIIAFVFHYTWPIIVLALACMGIYFTIRSSNAILKYLRLFLKMLAKYLPTIFGSTILLLLIYLVAPFIIQKILLPFFHFLKVLLTPVCNILLFIVKWIIIILLFIFSFLAITALVLFCLALLGSLLWSQLQAGWHASRSLRHVLIAGFAIGSMIGLIAVESIGTPALAASINQACINALAFLHLVPSQTSTHIITYVFELLLPQNVEYFIFTYLTNLQAPAFDSFIFLLVMTLACMSFFFRAFSLSQIEDRNITIQFAAKEYAIMVGGLFVSLIIVFLAAISGDSSST